MEKVISSPFPRVSLIFWTVGTPVEFERQFVIHSIFAFTKFIDVDSASSIRTLIFVEDCCHLAFCQPAKSPNLTIKNKIKILYEKMSTQLTSHRHRLSIWMLVQWIGTEFVLFCFTFLIVCFGVLLRQKTIHWSDKSLWTWAGTVNFCSVCFWSSPGIGVRNPNAANRRIVSGPERAHSSQRSE